MQKKTMFLTKIKDMVMMFYMKMMSWQKSNDDDDDDVWPDDDDECVGLPAQKTGPAASRGKPSGIATMKR